MSSDLNLDEGCPQCGVSTNLLHPIDQGMRLRLESEGQATSFEAVCSSCYKEMSKGLTGASVIRAEETIKKNHRSNLWKNRLSLVRSGRQLMDAKRYAEAAVCYEKYLKVVEFVYEKKRADITADLFKDHPREVTLIVASLWNLVEIYDLHPNYWSRQEAAAQKLGELASYTNLFASMVKQSGFKRKIAKNPRAYKTFLKAANVNAGHCFIATAVFEKEEPALQTLRLFRDQVLTRSKHGQILVNGYYRWSPAIAYRLQHSEKGKILVRGTLKPIAACLKVLFDLKH